MAFLTRVPVARDMGKVNGIYRGILHPVREREPPPRKKIPVASADLWRLRAEPPTRAVHRDPPKTRRYAASCFNS